MSKILIGAAWCVLAQGALADGLWRGQPVTVAPGNPGGVVTGLVVDRSQYGAIKEAGEVQLEGFPLAADARVRLMLERIEMFTPDAKVIEASAAGEREVALPDAVFLGGTVEGDADSMVFLTLTPDRLEGLVRTNGHTFVVSSGENGQLLPTVIYDMGVVSPELLNLTGGACEMREVPGRAPEVAGAAGGFGGRDLPCRVATIAIESDFETFQTYGSTQGTTSYLTGLVGVVSQIYFHELNVRFQIPYLRVWTDAGDPWTATDSGPQLDEFRAYWATNMRATRRTLAHYLTTRGLGGGVAWVGVLCNYDYGFGLSSGIGGGYPYPMLNHDSRNWPLMVTAHELGHNFGTGHTHDSYTPVIDGCGNGDCTLAWEGTIMSYCHTCAGGMRNISLIFGPRVVERIVSFMDTPGVCRLTGHVVWSRHPRAAAVRRGRAVTFTALATAPGIVTYQWYKNGVRISGLSAPGEWTIGSTTPADAGWYSARALTPCTFGDSQEALLTVLCRGDFNHDGFVDFFDADAFFACFDGGACPAGETADFNGDGFADFFDVDEFVSAFEGDC